MKDEKVVWNFVFVCSAMGTLEEQKNGVTEMRKIEITNNYD